MTIRQALTAASTQFAANPHLRDHAHRDAELLLLHVLQLPRSTLLAHPERELLPGQLAAYECLIDRRLTMEPIQYIIGQQEFYGLNLHVTPAVLIPRPETEHLIEAVLARLPGDQPLRIVDIGTGSGAIAIALAVHLPLAEITALDLSPEALHVAQTNAREHSVGHRIRFLLSDLLATIAHETGYDAIVSNPPYISAADHDTLSPQVRDYEPHTALFAGPDGLDIYSRLIPQARYALKPNGLLAMEIGHGQREAMTSLLTGWQQIAFIDDLQQIPRVALAHRPASDL
jgi:release factor glutamine methyltransferase